MQNCDKVCDMLTEYINRRLSASENNEVVLHLATCLNCKKEIAQLIVIKNMINSNIVNVPEDILDCAFEKITKKSTLDEILESGTYNMAYELISYTISVVQQTMQLAKQTILI